MFLRIIYLESEKTTVQIILSIEFNRGKIINRDITYNDLFQNIYDLILYKLEKIYIF